MNDKVKNIIKISSPGGYRVRQENTNNISITKERDQIVLDVEKKDVKPLYFDETAAKYFMQSPEYRAGIFPLNCKYDRKIEVLCGQDDCALYVSGESRPISVLPPPPPPPPPECPNPPCTPCPQTCDDGSCPPCDPPPLPCPCQGSEGLATAGSFFPNCPPNPCGAACPCPDGGCPPCDGGCECPGCETPCPDGGCPPCSECDPDTQNCCDSPGACTAAGGECCMCNRGGQCMSITTFQYGHSSSGPKCPTGVICGDEGECEPTWDPDPEIICPGSDCNCPCDTNQQPCNRAAGASQSALILCNKTTRTYCNSSENTNTFTSEGGGQVILDFDSGLISMGGIDFSGLPPASDTTISNINGQALGEGTGYDEVPCGSGNPSGAPCMCRCCVRQPCGGTPLCGTCDEDAPPSTPPMESMCSGSGTSIIYRKMCAGSGMDFCAVVNNGGDCQATDGGCSAVPVVIASWYPNVEVEAIPSENPGDSMPAGFEIGLSGNPIGGPGAMGACNCGPGHGNGGATQTSDFDAIFPDTPSGEGEVWPDNNIRSCP